MYVFCGSTAACGDSRIFASRRSILKIVGYSFQGDATAAYSIWLAACLPFVDSRKAGCYNEIKKAAARVIGWLLPAFFFGVLNWGAVPFIRGGYFFLCVKHKLMIPISTMQKAKSPSYVTKGSPPFGGTTCRLPDGYSIA